MAENNVIDFQGVAVVSCSGKTSSEELIRKIIQDKFDSDRIYSLSFGDGQSFQCYPWHLSNKYFDADISFVMAQPQDDLLTCDLSSKIDALIIYLDTDDGDSLDNLNQWKPFIDRSGTEVSLLVVDSVRDDSTISRHSLLKWCIDHEFELIELEIDSSQNGDEYDDDESNGIERIFEALNSNKWATMQLKDAPIYRPSENFLHLLNQENKSDKDAHRISEAANEDEDDPSINVSGRLPQGEDPLPTSSLDVDKEIDFEFLFKKFQDMKTEADQLTGDERKSHAEKVTIAFWKALGGDESEIEGLDDT